MEINKWVREYKVRSFPWINGSEIYVNVQYYKPGQSINACPVWDKSVLIVNNEKGRLVVSEYLDSLVENIARMKIQEGQMPTMNIQ